jgi:adenosylmethionine-8-amino-7-oxononanoate aminotransferase
VAAFIAEPIMQMGGCVIPPPEYFPMIREICEKHDVLLIDDEVITGFGRTGKMFGIEHFGVVPDIMVMAKQLTSGYVPIGAAVTKPSVIGEFPVFRHIHTYGGHPVACRAAAVNLEIIKREGLVENAREMGEYFLDGLKELERHPIVGEVRGIGLWLGIEFVQDKKTKARFPEDNNPALRIVKRIREKGAFCRPSMQSIEIAPALIITRSDIDEAVKIIEEAIVEEVQFLGM